MSRASNHDRGLQALPLRADENHMGLSRKPRLMIEWSLQQANTKFRILVLDQAPPVVRQSLRFGAAESCHQASVGVSQRLGECRVDFEYTSKVRAGNCDFHPRLRTASAA